MATTNWTEFYNQKPVNPAVGHTTQPIKGIGAAVGSPIGPRASSLSGGSYGGYFDAGPRRGFISPEQGQRMLKNPDAFKATPSELRLIREGLNLPQASAGGEIGKIASASPGEGWAWFGNPEGEGRWGVDTDSDYWDSQLLSEYSPDLGTLGDQFRKGESEFTKAIKAREKAANQYNLPGWFSGSVIESGPLAGKAYGMLRHSGGLGFLSQGGDLTAEHYNQPGSWSFTPMLRPDGSQSHEVGDLYWGMRNREKFKEGGEYHNWDYSKQWDAAPFYTHINPEEYQEGVDEQIGRMRQERYDKATAEDASPFDISALQAWDEEYGIEGGKHWTQDWKKEEERASKQERLKQEKEGVVRSELETDQADKGFTLAERLKSLSSAAGQYLTSTSREKPEGDYSFNPLEEIGRSGAANLGKKQLQTEAFRQRQIADLAARPNAKSFTVLPPGVEFNPSHQSPSIGELWAKNTAENKKLGTKIWETLTGGAKLVPGAVQDQYGGAPGEIHYEYGQTGGSRGVKGTAGGVAKDQVTIVGRDIHKTAKPGLGIKDIFSPGQGWGGSSEMRFPSGSAAEVYQQVDKAGNQLIPDSTNKLQKAIAESNVIKHTPASVLKRLGASTVTGGVAALNISEAAQRAKNKDYIGLGILGAENVLPTAPGWIATGANILGDTALSGAKDAANKFIHNQIVPTLGNPEGRTGKIPRIKSNKAMKGKSLGNVGGRNIYEIPSFNQF